jgi:hypothetical protein
MTLRSRVNSPIKHGSRLGWYGADFEGCDYAELPDCHSWAFATHSNLLAGHGVTFGDRGVSTRRPPSELHV